MPDFIVMLTLHMTYDTIKKLYGGLRYIVYLLFGLTAHIDARFIYADDRFSLRALSHFMCFSMPLRLCHH